MRPKSRHARVLGGLARWEFRASLAPRPSQGPTLAASLTRMFQLSCRLSCTFQARRVKVAPFVLGRRPVPRAAVSAALAPGLSWRQGQRWPRAFALRALDPEEPRHGARPPRVAAADRNPR